MSNSITAPYRHALPGAALTNWVSVDGNRGRLVAGAVVEEAQACLTVNGFELANFMCSPLQLEWLALGFLYNEGIIDTIETVASIHRSKANCIDIWLKHDFEPPKRMIITAGCGGGVTFDDLSAKHEPLQSDMKVSAETLCGLMKAMFADADLYKQARGIHTAALATSQTILLQVEDLGRHNTIDKIAGAVLKQRLQSHDRILLTSGRISSEMLNKARRLRTPVICSRTSPTSLTLKLAEAWGITVIGYLRQNKLRAYTHPQRIIYRETI